MKYIVLLIAVTCISLNISGIASSCPTCRGVSEHVYYDEYMEKYPDEKKYICMSPYNSDYECQTMPEYVDDIEVISYALINGRWEEYDQVTITYHPCYTDDTECFD